MAYIQTRTDGRGRTRYRVQIRLKGHPSVSATFDRKTDAKEWSGKTEADIKRGLFFPEQEERKHTFGEMIDRYLKDVMPRKSKSQQRHQTQQLKWWKRKLKDFTLADVSPAKLVQVRDELATTPPKGKDERSPASVNRYLAALSHVYTIAVREWGWCQDSPIRKVSRLKEPQGRVRFLSDNERKTLLENCQASDEPLLYPLVLLALSTGARQSELLTLKWEHVDLQRRAIRLEKTKNRERRALPLAGLAFDEISLLSKVRRIDSDFVFPHTGKDRPLEIRKPWEAAVKAAGLEDFRFHDLRHSAASYLAMSGATLAEIAEILGHKTLQMVKRYSHLTEQHTSAVVARMNERYLRG